MLKYISADRKQIQNIRKQQADWQARYLARVDEYNGQKQDFYTSVMVWKRSIAALVTEHFQPYLQQLDHVSIGVGIGYPMLADTEGGVCISFTCGAPDAFDSVWWEYSVAMTDAGEIRSKQVQWKNLDSATPEEADLLLKYAELIKAAINFDWSEILHKALNSLPVYENFVTIRDPQYDPEYQDPGFREQLVDAAVRDYVGKDVWICVGNDCWTKLLRYDSDNNRYVVTVVDFGTMCDVRGTPGVPKDQIYDQIQHPENYYRNIRPSRIRLFAKYPLELATTPELLEQVDLYDEARPS